MPEGPLGFPRLTNIGPFVESSEDKKEELIRQELTKYAHSVTYTGGVVGDRYTFRLNISNGSDIAASDEVRRLLPTHQNIPSNIEVIGMASKGTLRPPNISKRIGRKELDLINGIKHLYDGIEGRQNIEVILRDSSSGKRYRPHIHIQNNVHLEDMLKIIKVTTEDFIEEGLGISD